LQSGGFREEVLNVALASLLDKRGLVSVPEEIRQSSKGKRLPDVTVVDYLGIRTTIEGRIADVAGVESSLAADASRRVDEGISQICIAVIYPSSLRNSTTFEQLQEAMRSCMLRLRVFTEGERGDWTEASVDGLADVLRRAYDSLVRQDVLDAAVVELGNAIEDSCDGLLESPASAEILREILELKATSSKSEEEDDE